MKLKQNTKLLFILLITFLFLSACNKDEDNKVENKKNNEEEIIYNLDYLNKRISIHNFQQEYNQISTDDNLKIEKLNSELTEENSDFFYKDVYNKYTYSFNNDLIINIQTINDLVQNISVNIKNNNKESINYKNFINVSKNLINVLTENNEYILNNLDFNNPNNENNIVYSNHGVYGLYSQDSNATFLIELYKIEEKDFSLEDLKQLNKDKFHKYSIEYPSLSDNLEQTTNNINKLIAEYKQEKIENEEKWIKEFYANSQFIHNDIKTFSTLEPPTLFNEFHEDTKAIHDMLNKAVMIYIEELNNKTTLNDLNAEKMKEAHEMFLKAKAQLPSLKGEMISIIHGVNKVINTK